MATAKPGTPGTPAASPTPIATLHAQPPVVQLGKVKNKDAKKLKKGKAGKLTDKLNQQYQQIQANVEGSSTPVYITYEVKPRTTPKKKKKNKVNFMGLKIDRKKFKSNMKKNGVNPTFL